MMRPYTLLAVLLASGLAAADWADAVGKEPPDCSTTWLREHEGRTFQDLRGRVIVLVFWTTGDRAADDLFLMEEMHHGMYAEGGRLIALTAGKADDARKLVADEDVSFAVGADTKHPEFGDGALPYAYLVGTDGLVLWQGAFADLPARTLDGALRKVQPFALRQVHDMQEKAAKLYGKGKLFEAACEALYVGEFSEDYFKGNAKRIALIKEDAAYIKERVEAYRAYWWRLVDEGQARGDFDRVLYALEEIRLHLDGEYFKAKEYGVRAGDADRAAATRATLKKDATVQRALKAEKGLQALVRTQQTTRLTADAKAKLLQRFADFQREWEGTYAARRAARRARWLEGLPATD